MAVSTNGEEVYVAIFESGNGTTVLGGGAGDPIASPPNVVNDPAGPWNGLNPPPNDGSGFKPPFNPLLPAPPGVSLIVRLDGAGMWMDDNGGDWTNLVSGNQAQKSGRPVGWELLDHDIAVLDANTLSVSYVDGLMNLNMALAVNPVTNHLSVVGTEAINELRFEPNVNGIFVRSHLALINLATSPPAASISDMNNHLDYSVSTLPQSERTRSLGDPRGVAWNGAGDKIYVTGMGSNNVIVLDETGNRIGLSETIEVGEGPTGIVVSETHGQAYVLNKFSSSISVLDLSTETVVSSHGFFDPSPLAIKQGRRHLYDTHETSGLGQVSCGSCHVDSRMDRLAWDLGDPAGVMESPSDQNLGANAPGLNNGFQDWHPMKGPMLTQTLQDIVDKEPFHWRGDRFGLEEFNGAFLSLLGDDDFLDATEMQEFEDFLATIYFPPNPHRNLDNSLPTNLPLEGHYTTGRFGPPGIPYGTGNAIRGLDLYRPPNLLDAGALACSTCHTLPVGVGTDSTLNLFPPTFVPFPTGPFGEHHTMLVSVDGFTNVTMKVPQLRNIYERDGMNFTQPQATTGFGFAHDGTVDSIERFIAEPIFTPSNEQDVADLVAFMLAFSGSDLPLPDGSDLLEPPSVPGRDAHAAVGIQTTVVDNSPLPPTQDQLIDTLIGLSHGNRVGLVAKGRVDGLQRGWTYQGGGIFQSDRSSETATKDTLLAKAGFGAEITFTAVPGGSETRIGIDRDRDSHLDQDEMDAFSDPADPASIPGVWLNLFGSLAGTGSLKPTLNPAGTLAPGSAVSLTLAQALPSTFAHLVVGLSPINTPFKGGLLIPSPDVIIPNLPVNGLGGGLLSGTWPGGIPSGTNFVFQVWIQDSGGPAGFSATNGVVGTTP